VKNK
jgi:hypothetical protein